MSSLINIVNEIVQFKRHSREYLENYINTYDPKFKELEIALDYIIRSKKMISNHEKAYCFLVIYNAIRNKSQIPTFPDPKTGCNPKKINSVAEFVEYNKDSIFGFIGELEILINI